MWAHICLSRMWKSVCLALMCVCWRTLSSHVSVWHQKVCQSGTCCPSPTGLPNDECGSSTGRGQCVSIAAWPPPHTGLSILMMGVMIENDGHWGFFNRPASVTETSVDLTVGDADMAWQGQTVIKRATVGEDRNTHNKICTGKYIQYVMFVCFDFFLIWVCVCLSAT